MHANYASYFQTILDKCGRLTLCNRCFRPYHLLADAPLHGCQLLQRCDFHRAQTAVRRDEELDCEGLWASGLFSGTHLYVISMLSSSTIPQSASSPQVFAILFSSNLFFFLRNLLQNSLSSQWRYDEIHELNNNGKLLYALKVSQFLLHTS